MMESHSDVEFHNEDGRCVALPIKLQPGFGAEVYPGHVDVFCENDVPDAYGSCFGFPNGISLDVPKRESEIDIAIDLWAARATSEFHEILEFMQLNGERLAIPHPKPEEEMWKWVYGRMRRLAVDYMKRYPIEDPNAIQPTG